MPISCNRVPSRAPWYWITDTFPNADWKRDEGAARRFPFGALREPRLSLKSPLQDKARCSSQDATVDRGKGEMLLYWGHTWPWQGGLCNRAPHVPRLKTELPGPQPCSRAAQNQAPSTR